MMNFVSGTVGLLTAGVVQTEEVRAQVVCIRNGRKGWRYEGACAGRRRFRLGCSPTGAWLAADMLVHAAPPTAT